MTDDQWQSLNREFYDAQPSAYLRDRLTLLAVRAVRTDALAGLIEEGIVWEQLRIVHDESEPTQDDAGREEAARQRFVVTESQILLHHASEALLRMFLAHEGRPECPWLRMAALFDFSEFRKEVDLLAKAMWPQERKDAVADVFVGGVLADPPPEYVEHRDTAVRLLRLLAQRLQSDKKIYNSAKHGLTSLAGVGSIQFFREEDGKPVGEPVLGADGVNVAFLEREGTRKSGFTWFKKTQWLNPEQAAWLTHLVILQMEALWAVARWHYLGEQPGKVQLVNSAAIDAFRDQFPRTGVQSWRQAVATENRIDGDDE